MEKVFIVELLELPMEYRLGMNAYKDQGDAELAMDALREQYKEELGYLVKMYELEVE